MSNKMALNKCEVSVNYDDEIVISGVSGRFPESDNMTKFRYNLMNKVDMMQNNHRSSAIQNSEMAKSIGFINNRHKFDADFFNFTDENANAADPTGRMLLEHAYEAIIDAGINPQKLKGTDVGVFIATSFLASNASPGSKDSARRCERTGLVQQVSLALGLTGPGCVIDSDSLFAVDRAYRAIRAGQCSGALVGGANLRPASSRSDVSAADGRSKSSDGAADACATAEAISVAYLQRAKDAKRIYATIVNTKTNCGGCKKDKMTFTSKKVQSLLLQQVYEECDVSPSSLAYVEAHGTGTTVGDSEELKAIDSVCCVERKEPLKIGSIKADIGDAQSAIGMAQIAKVIIACETGIIPSNLHYKPRDDVNGLKEGRLQVVTEPTPWSGGYVGINSAGRGAASAHVLLKSNPKEKIAAGAPEDNLPRLVFASGRTEEAVKSILRYVEDHPADTEFIGLIHEIHAEDLIGHHYRGYTVVTSDSANRHSDIGKCSREKRPTCFVFPGMGVEWPTSDEYSCFLRFPVFSNAVKKCDAVLQPLGINIHGLLTNDSSGTFDHLLKSFVGLAALQIGLIDLLASLRIHPDAVIGHAVGELGCAYAEKCLTVEQTVLAAYYVALSFVEMGVVDGHVAIVHLGYEKLKDLCPKGIDAIGYCDNQKCLVSGAEKLMKSFKANLKSDNVSIEDILYNKDISSVEILPKIKARILSHLKTIIPKPKSRSSAWLSAVRLEFGAESSDAELCSAEYIVNSFLSLVIIEELSTVIPKNAIAIEIAPGWLSSTDYQKSSASEIRSVSLLKKDTDNSVEFLLRSIGELYNIGLQPAVSALYPAIAFPVSRGTAMISPLIKWDHSKDYGTNSFNI